MAIQKVINNAIVSGIKIIKGGTKRKAITSESEVSEPEIDRSEEHQDHQVPAQNTILDKIFYYLCANIHKMYV